MRYMLEWKTRRGTQRMGSPDLQVAKQDAISILKEGKTECVLALDLNSPFPYVKATGWRLPRVQSGDTRCTDP